MNRNNVIAVDQSFTSTAAIVIDVDGNLKHFECIKTTKNNSNVHRAKTIADRLIWIYDNYNCSEVVCESLAFGSIGNATRNLAFLLGAIELKFLENYGYSELPKVAPTALKKFATGSGKAKKEDMIEALPENIREKFLEAGYKKTTGLSDLADSYFIGMYFIKHLDEMH